MSTGISGIKTNSRRAVPQRSYPAIQDRRWSCKHALQRHFKGKYTSDLVIQYFAPPRISATGLLQAMIAYNGAAMDYLSLQEAPLMFCCAMLSGTI